MNIASVPISRRRALNSITRKSDIRKYAIRGLIMVPKRAEKAAKVESAKKKLVKSKRKLKVKPVQLGVGEPVVVDAESARAAHLEPVAKKAKTAVKKTKAKAAKVKENRAEAGAKALEEGAASTSAVEVQRQSDEVATVVEEVEEAPVRLEFKGDLNGKMCTN